MLCNYQQYQICPKRGGNIKNCKMILINMVLHTKSLCTYDNQKKEENPHQLVYKNAGKLLPNPVKS